MNSLAQEAALAAITGTTAADEAASVTHEDFVEAVDGSRPVHEREGAALSA